MSAVEVEQIVAAFTDATNRHDVDEMLALVADDVVFEGTTPPDGVRIEGRQGVASGSVGRHLSQLATCGRTDRGTDRLW